MCFRNIPIVIFVTIVLITEGNSRKPRILDDTLKERRDYRPSKWVPNSAMDIWYGNKSMVEVISREFNELMNRIIERPVRSVIVLRNETETPKNSTHDAPQKLKIPVQNYVPLFDILVSVDRDLKNDTLNLSS